MNKDVLIKIVGTHSGEEQEIITEHVGTYHKKEGKHYLIFRENPDENASPEGEIKSKIVFDDDNLSIRKKGVVTSLMNFARGKKMEGKYDTGYGVFDIETETEHMFIEEKEDSIYIRVKYSLYLNGEKNSDSICKIMVVSIEE